MKNCQLWTEKKEEVSVWSVLTQSPACLNPNWTTMTAVIQLWLVCYPKSFFALEKNPNNHAQLVFKIQNLFVLLNHATVLLLSELQLLPVKLRAMPLTQACHPHIDDHMLPPYLSEVSVEHWKLSCIYTKQSKPQRQKTEVLLCGLLSKSESIPAGCILVREASIPLSNVVKTPRVVLDTILSFVHVSRLSSDPWAKSVHTSLTRLQEALLSHWFCQT